MVLLAAMLAVAAMAEEIMTNKSVISLETKRKSDGKPNFRFPDLAGK